MKERAKNDSGLLKNVYIKESLRLVNNNIIVSSMYNLKHILNTIYSKPVNNYFIRFLQAALQYPLTAAENLMRRARQQSLPAFPRSIRYLADLFQNGNLNRYIIHI